MLVRRGFDRGRSRVGWRGRSSLLRWRLIGRECELEGIGDAHFELLESVWDPVG